MTSNTVIFQGWKFSYKLKNADLYRTAFFKHCNRNDYTVRGRKVRGESLTHAVSCLRDYAELKVPGGRFDQEAMFVALGFSVVQGINSRGQECTVVFCD